jgi:hypothetical protein
MSSSIVECDPSVAPEALDFFRKTGVRVIGTVACDGFLGLRIEGDAVPAATRVRCDIDKEHDSESASLVARFTPLKDHR